MKTRRHGIGIRLLAVLIAWTMLAGNVQTVYADEPVVQETDTASVQEDEAEPQEADEASSDAGAETEQEEAAGNDEQSADPYLTNYEFYVDGALAASQTVQEGDTLYEPEVPETNGDKTFTGWADADGKGFTGFGTVGKIDEDGRTVRLYAQYTDALYLYYYDQYDNLISSQAVAPNSTVTVYKDAPIIQVEPLTQCQDGWTTTKGGSEDVSGEFRVGEESVSLYPILRDGYWVSFETNSDTSIERQFIDYDAQGDDRKVTKPSFDPFKKGYTFDQWYADKDLTQPYDFDTEVTGAMTLYAGYIPAEGTQYTVRYLVEKQTAIDPDGSVEGGTWEYVLTAIETRSGKTGDAAEYDPDLIYSSQYGYNTKGYELDTDQTIAPTIAADGSTVYNVYYKCKTFKLTIGVPRADGTTETLTYPAVKFSASMTNFWKAVFAIRPEEELFDGKHRFTGTGNAYIEGASAYSSMLAQDFSMWYSSKGENNNYYEVYLETLNGEAPVGKDVVTNQSVRKAGDDRTYYLDEASNWHSGTYGCHNIYNNTYTGFSYVPQYSDGTYRVYTNGYRVWYRIPYSKENEDSGLHYPYDEDGNRVTYTGKDQPLRMYFSRNVYTMTFHTDGGEAVDPASVPYEDKLGNHLPSGYVVGETTKVEGNRTLVFGGWYTDADCTTALNESDTMPAYDVDIYAKWIAETYTVKFDTGNGSKIDDITGIAYGETFAAPADPTYEGHVFLGWTLNGRPYNMINGVTRDITLVAEWRSIDAFAVRYDLNGGSGTTPVDDGKYYENAGVTVAAAKGVTAPEGKVFLGWLSSGDHKIYYPNSSAPMAYGGMTLTAQWGDKDQATTLIYDFNYEHFNISYSGASMYAVSALRNNSRVTLEDITSLTTIPANATFQGWYLDADCTDGPYSNVLVSNLKESGNRVYARWTVSSPAPSPDPTPSVNPSDGGSDGGNTTPTPTVVYLTENGDVVTTVAEPEQVLEIVESGSEAEPVVIEENGAISTTGDDSLMTVYGAAAAAAAGVLALWFVKRRRYA